MALLHAQTAVITVPESNAVDFVYTDPTNVSRYAWKPSGKITFNKVIRSSFVIGVYWSKISSNITKGINPIMIKKADCAE